MPTFEFTCGLRILLHKREHILDSRLPDGQWKLKDVINETFSVVSENDLVNALFEGQLESLGEESPVKYVRRKSAKNLAADFTKLPIEKKNEAKRRRYYVEAARGLPFTTASSDLLKPVITEVSSRIEDKTPPSPLTLYRWRRDYEASGRDIRSLVPSTEHRGNNKDRLQEQVSVIIDEEIRRVYLKPGATVMNVWDAVDGRIATTNKMRQELNEIQKESKWEILERVSKVTIYNRVNKFKAENPELVDKARHGETFTKHKYMVVGAGPRSERPLERMEMDHTKLDLFVVDEETRLPIGRPWLTTALDHCCKGPCGFYLGFTPPSYLSVMNALKHAILPKSYLRKKFPEVVNDWPMYGIPSLLVVDNGPEFVSADLDDACLQIGTIVERAPVKVPWYKGTVERWFGTLNTRLLQGKPGGTFSDILSRGDYDPQKNAVISLPALLEMIHLFIVDIFLRSKHRGIREVPGDVWKAGTADFCPTLPSRPADLNVLIGHLFERHITRHGIEWKTLLYQSPEIQLVARRLGKRKATIKFDPNDIGTVYALDPLTGQFVPAPAISQSYASGLTIWQHKVISDFARQRVNDSVDSTALALAKAKIQEIVDREWDKTKRASTRQKMARWREEGSNQITSLRKSSLPSSICETKSPVIDPGITDTEKTTWQGISELGNETDETKASSVVEEQPSLSSTPNAGAQGRVVDPTKTADTPRHPRSRKSKPASQNAADTATATDSDSEGSEAKTADRQDAAKDDSDPDMSEWGSSYYGVTPS